MLASVRYTSSLGNSALYARLRNGTGQFWDLVGLTWVGTITANCKGFLTEYSDGDPSNSLYVSTITIPSGGPWIIEIVQDSDSSVLGYETTRDDQISNITGDTYGLLTGADTELSAVPATTGSIIEKIKFLFQYFRNKKVVSSTTESLYKEDASTVLGTASVSESATEFTKGEMN